MGLKTICSVTFRKVVNGFCTKLGGQVGCITRTNRFDFGEDPDPRILMFFFGDFSPLRDMAKNDIVTAWGSRFAIRGSTRVPWRDANQL